MTESTFEEIKQSLNEQLIHIKEEDMDAASWGYEAGVLLSGNQAKFLIENTMDKSIVERDYVKKNLYTATDPCAQAIQDALTQDAALREAFIVEELKPYFTFEKENGQDKAILHSFVRVRLQEIKDFNDSHISKEVVERDYIKKDSHFCRLCLGNSLDCYISTRIGVFHEKCWKEVQEQYIGKEKVGQVIVKLDPVYVNEIFSQESLDDKRKSFAYHLALEDLKKELNL
jgi:hypothetical protein